MSYQPGDQVTVDFLGNHWGGVVTEHRNGIYRIRLTTELSRSEM